MEDQHALTPIDNYIQRFPPEIQTILKALRSVIRSAAPEAEEKISYQMPTYVLAGNLVHFAAFKNHVGFYPTPSAIEAYAELLIGYKCSKGAIQFPFNTPIPYDLVDKIVKFRVEENLKKQREKSPSRKTSSTRLRQRP